MPTAPPPPPPSPTAPPLAACGYTHPGRVRADNEDALGLFLEDRLFIVADGMGGRNAGEVAAHMAVDELHAFFRTQRANPSAPWPFPVEQNVSLGANLLRVGVKLVNQKVRLASAQDTARHRMGATIAALAIGETQLVAAHVGDARIYRLRKSVLQRLTRDHSIAEEVRAVRPDLSAEEISTLGRNVITRAIGTKEDVEPTVYLNSFARGDVYLLCSDGLWSVVPDETISALLEGNGDIEIACQALIDAANEAGGPDNVTALLVRVAD